MELVWRRSRIPKQMSESPSPIGQYDKENYIKPKPFFKKEVNEEEIYYVFE